MAAPGAIAAPFAGSHVSSDAGRLVLPLVEEKVRRPTQTGQASLPPRASVDMRPPPLCDTQFQCWSVRGRLVDWKQRSDDPLHYTKRQHCSQEGPGG